MRVLVATELRFTRGVDGSLVGPVGVAPNFFDRYLDVFHSVTVLARVFPGTTEGGNAFGDRGIAILPAPLSGGFRSLFDAVLPGTTREVQRALSHFDRVVLRLPGLVSLVAGRAAQRASVPYATELVGDPQAAMEEALSGRLGSATVAKALARATRRVSKAGVGVAAVHEGLLGTYGTGRAVDTSYSSIDLGPEQIRGAARAAPTDREIRIGCVASLAVPYKGVDDLLAAVPQIVAQSGDRDVQVLVAGDGAMRRDLEVMANALAPGRVTFLGQLPGSASVIEFLDTVDVLVHPARTEGLPRAVIEAQARGVPVVATAVGGVPTLVDPPYLVPPRSPAAVATAVVAVMQPEAYQRASASSLASAARFVRPVIAERRREFYESLRDGGDRP